MHLQQGVAEPIWVCDGDEACKVSIVGVVITAKLESVESFPDAILLNSGWKGQFELCNEFIPRCIVQLRHVRFPPQLRRAFELKACQHRPDTRVDLAFDESLARVEFPVGQVIVPSPCKFPQCPSRGNGKVSPGWITPEGGVCGINRGCLARVILRWLLYL
ncbi:hypothetical protein BCV69DRAFT_82536 [Microstroma glucosiphilum]|uniref:Uncharacterized protein n=1 Tax=Pseudomicrostroma glucosiphilum TaxID=1684307 RepID=A0A316U0C0_9BASI|nr:hypothetical protein BCV69DRAFT_82536 [Pseudomicrostroma glucosiphilum]PWN18334.1 hypothetical protein BCV69DRAFT_82536 [Pseudomicrostroma glucosiphilum]